MQDDDADGTTTGHVGCKVHVIVGCADMNADSCMHTCGDLYTDLYRDIIFNK